MARREVEPDPEYGKKKFLKVKEVFADVGAKFTGLYQEDEEGQFGQNYTFKLRTGEPAVLTVKGELAVQLKKAKLQRGEKVTILFVGEKVIDGFDSPKRLFKVTVEDAPAAAAKPPPPPVAEDPW